MINKFRRRFIVNAPFTPPSDLTGRKFIVTGASPNSLGFATAKSLLEWGAEVTVTCRANSESLVKSLQAVIPPEARARIFAHNLELSDTESVSAFFKWYQKEHQELDVLINNAGIHLDLLSKWQKPKLSDDNIEIQWRTNYLGTLHLTHLLLPLLKDSAKKTNDSRIVNVVSMLHDRGSNGEFFDPVKPYNSWEAYGFSKLGLIHITYEIQRRYSAIGLQAYCLHPGSVYTNVADKGLAGNPLLETIRNAFSFVEAFFLKTPEEGAQTQLHCATAKDLAGGTYYRNCRKAPASDDTEDSAIAGKLWDQSLEWLESH